MSNLRFAKNGNEYIDVNYVIKLINLEIERLDRDAFKCCFKRGKMCDECWNKKQPLLRLKDKLQNNAITHQDHSQEGTVRKDAVALPDTRSQVKKEIDKDYPNTKKWLKEKKDFDRERFNSEFAKGHQSEVQE